MPERTSPPNSLPFLTRKPQTKQRNLDRPREDSPPPQIGPRPFFGGQTSAEAYFAERPAETAGS